MNVYNEKVFYVNFHMENVLFNTVLLCDKRVYRRLYGEAETGVV